MTAVRNLYHRSMYSAAIVPVGYCGSPCAKSGTVPYLLESTADLRRRIAVLQRDLELGCASCELEALQRLLWYRDGEVGGAGSGSSSSRYRSRQEL